MSLIFIPMLVLTVATVSIISIYVVSTFLKYKSNVSIMLLGIAIILTGGIIAVDAESNLGGVEYFIVLLGLALTIGGFAKKESNE